MRMTALIAGLFLLAAVGAAQADEAHFGQTAFSTENGTEAQNSFAPNTPKIVLHVQVEDSKKGDKVSAAWIAEKTSASAPPNYKIDSATVTIDDPEEDEVAFSISKPNAGWPVGDYRVDLDINGKAKKSASFKIGQ